MSRDCNHTAVSEYSEESAAIFGNGHQMVKNKVKYQIHENIDELRFVLIPMLAAPEGPFRTKVESAPSMTHGPFQ
jgi:hypothetical protein